MTHVRKTSIATFYEIRDEGLLSRMRFVIYECLFCHGPLTAQEVFKRLSLESNQSGRFTEMREMGVVYEVGERECRITGRDVIEWDVTGDLPKEYIKQTGRPSRKELREAADELREIYRWIKARNHSGFSDNLKHVGRWMTTR